MATRHVEQNSRAATPECSRLLSFFIGQSVAIGIEARPCHVVVCALGALRFIWPCHPPRFCDLWRIREPLTTSCGLNDGGPWARRCLARASLVARTHTPLLHHGRVDRRRRALNGTPGGGLLSCGSPICWLNISDSRVFCSVAVARIGMPSQRWKVRYLLPPQPFLTHFDFFLRPEHPGHRSKRLGGASSCWSPDPPQGRQHLLADLLGWASGPT